ncbi:uncharacterized protein TNCV_2552231 [Trichonephila clavipes]|nr:uncharacterized protein TNCV_2552231 [Trichonephila clavipes]
MTLHNPTENSLAVLNHKILEANSQVQKAKLGGHQTCLSMNRLRHELCDMLRLVETTAPGHHDCSIKNEKPFLHHRMEAPLRHEFGSSTTKDTVYRHMNVKSS